MPDLLVNLSKLPVVESEPREFLVRRAQPFEISAVRSFVGENFSTSWADEISVGFARQPISVFVATIVGAAGPVRFYPKTVGAIVIPDSEPGIYTDLLKSKQ